MNDLNGSVAKLDANKKLSGQGVGSHQGHTVKQFCQDSGSISHAHAYLAFKCKGELHDFTTTLNSSAAAMNIMFLSFLLLAALL